MSSGYVVLCTDFFCICIETREIKLVIGNIIWLLFIYASLNYSQIVLSHLYENTRVMAVIAVFALVWMSASMSVLEFLIISNEV